MQSRLEQVKFIAEQLAEDKTSTSEVLMQYGGFIGSPEEVHSLREQISSLSVPSIEVVNDLIDELNIIERFDWQYIAEIQEKCTSLILAAYEEPLRLKAMNHQIFSRLMDAVRQHIKASSCHQNSASETDVPTLENYSTPSLEAMRSAIEQFWLNHDENKPPTQKAVSNFIAEQLGKPIRDRFTDELARAIKPE
jgi:hypothetical protein